MGALTDARTIKIDSHNLPTSNGQLLQDRLSAHTRLNFLLGQLCPRFQHLQVQSRQINTFS